MILLIPRAHEDETARSPHMTPAGKRATPSASIGGFVTSRHWLCGYRFGDELLADEILGAIEGEPRACHGSPYRARSGERTREMVCDTEAYGSSAESSGALASRGGNAKRIGNERQTDRAGIFAI